MCIIIAAPFNEEKPSIGDDVLEECARTNSHGMGIAFVIKDKFTVYKSLNSLGRLIRKYNKAHKEGANILMHFRIATHGAISAANCHPFMVTKDLAFAHNGVIAMPGLGWVTADRANCGEVDTVKFCKEILRPIAERNSNFLEDEKVIHLIRKYIGSSKLAFIDRKGQLTIINRSKGHEDTETGAWFSNCSFRPIFTTTYRRWIGPNKVDDSDSRVIEAETERLLLDCKEGKKCYPLSELERQVYGIKSTRDRGYPSF